MDSIRNYAHVRVVIGLRLLAPASQRLDHEDKRLTKAKNSLVDKRNMKSQYSKSAISFGIASKPCVNYTKCGNR